MTEIDDALNALAEACDEHLSRATFSKLWSDATPERIETIGSEIVDPAERRRAQIAHLYDSRLLTKFLSNLIILTPPPSAPVIAAVKSYFKATTVDLSRWDALEDVDQQAILSDRDAFLEGEDIVEFHQNAWPRVCCLVGETRRAEGGVIKTHKLGGTCFLVGPDVVLTNSHVIEPLLDPATGEARPDTHLHFSLFFDHHAKHVIDDHTKARPGLLRVAPAEHWRIARSPGANGGALPMDHCLDFALIRLETRVGMAARDRRGGRRRGWIEIPPAAPPFNVNDQVRIAIPQHPNGFGLVLDIGRAFGQIAGSATRVGYGVNTSDGSSGSPVLAKGGKLVALHEGAAPRGVGSLKANRGILIRAFGEAIRPHLSLASLPSLASTTHWNVGATHEAPRLLIGRKALIDWTEALLKPDAMDPGAPEPPIRVVLGGEKSGKSFSIDILRSVLRHTQDTVVAFSATAAGGGAIALPDRPDKLLLAVADALKLPTDSMPPAPPDIDQRETLIGRGAVTDLKPNSWTSNDLPKWLREALEAKPSAAAGRVWVIFDIPPRAPFGPLMRDFVSSWTKPVDVDHPFAVFRWLFIDYDPDFRTTAEKREEFLDPITDISPDDIGRFTAAAYDAAGFEEIPAGNLGMATAVLTVAKMNARERFWANLSLPLTATLSEIFPPKEQA